MNIDYTDCLPSENSSLQQSRSSESSSICEYSFSVSSLVQGPILLYYQLENYYQNSRIYVKSVEPNQLQGQALPYSQLSDCSPLQGPPGFDSMGDQRPVYYPCGLIANSFFNGKNNFIVFKYS